MRVSVIGSGYVGLVTAAGLAEIGHTILCVDKDDTRVDAINRGENVIYEPGLDELLDRHVGGRITATTDTRQAVLDTDLTIVTVDTPFDGTRIDLTSIRAVARDVGLALPEKGDRHTIVIKSTVVPGTTSSVVIPILEDTSGMSAGQDFGVAVNPEFLREGSAISDFLKPDRLVLGSLDPTTKEALDELYASFGEVDRVSTDLTTAELIKYTANSLLATLISFSNEIANLASVVGVDALDVMHGVHLDRRFTPIDDQGHRSWPGFLAYLKPGCGFGGSCFPKDVRSLVAFGSELGSQMRILDAVISVNDSQPQQVVDRVMGELGDLSGVAVTVLGLAFKPDTDDIRESPSIQVIEQLIDQRAVVTAFDPMAIEAARQVLGEGISYASSLEEAVDGAQAILLMTSWPEFAAVPGLVEGIRDQPLLVDGRRFLSKESIARYVGIGL